MIIAMIVFLGYVITKRKSRRGRRSVRLQMISDYSRFSAGEDNLFYPVTVAVKERGKKHGFRSSDFATLV